MSIFDRPSFEISLGAGANKNRRPQASEACEQLVAQASKHLEADEGTGDVELTKMFTRVAASYVALKGNSTIHGLETRKPGGEAYHCLAQLLPWWPSLKSSRSLEIVGLFSKMQSFAHEAGLVKFRVDFS